EIVQQGSPDDLISNPANEFVKEFIGEDRLMTNLALSRLELKDFILSTIPTIEHNVSMSTAINQLTTLEMSEIIVTKEDSEYAGILSLYKAINNQNESVKSIIEEPNLVINEKESIEKILNKLNNTQQIVPIIDENKKENESLKKIKLFLFFKKMKEIRQGIKKLNLLSKIFFFWYGTYIYIICFAKENMIIASTVILISILITIPLAIYMTRMKSDKLRGLIFSIANIFQTIPTIALLAIMIPIFGIGFTPAIVALYLYALLPLLRNTY